MTLINKVFAIAMLPFSLLIILEATKVLSIDMPFNKVLVGAILMITLQLLNIIFAKAHNGKLTVMNIITFVVFMAPPLAYFGAVLFGGDFLEGNIPLILGVMMLVEGLYALH